MSSVLEDICLEIFVRLPVQSLLTCKCVCKPWFELISSPSFSQLHLNHTTHKNNLNLMVKKYDRNKGTFICNSISSVRELDVVAVKIQHPFKSYGFDVQLVGSCNGLICFWSHTRKRFCLWNPATKEYKKIPKSQIEDYKKFNQGVCAFGYDCKNNDYKIINVVKLPTTENSSVDVYTLRTNSWRSSQKLLDGLPSRLFNGVLVKGALHWLKKTVDKIISLDISDETFEELQQPKELYEKEGCSIDMGVLECCLALVVYFEVHFEVWVMHEYGVPESWTRRWIIADDEIRHGSNIRLMCSFHNGEFLVLLTTDKLVIYDQKHASAKELSIRYIDLHGNAVNYFESLVSLNSGTYVGRKKKIQFKIKPPKLNTIHQTVNEVERLKFF